LVKLNCLQVKKQSFYSVGFLALTLVLVSWGGTGHRSINGNTTLYFNQELSAYTTWSSSLKSHASDADNRKSSDPSEGKKHYIDIDNYYEYQQSGAIMEKYEDAVAKYGYSKVDEWGILPWATVTTYDTLVRCFRRNDLNKAVLIAADLGHYVGDGHMPLHITDNYDGQNTGNKGIHSRYESDMIGDYIGQITYSSRDIAAIPDVRRYVFDYIYKNNKYVDDILAADNYAKGIDPSYGYAYTDALWEKTATITKELLPNAAHALAELIYTAFLEAKSTTGAEGMVSEKAISIDRCFPNPFSSSTSIHYTLAKYSNVEMLVIDSRGQLVANLASGVMTEGAHHVEWFPTSVTSGIYFLVARSDNFVETQKLVVIR
jgi:hypothetical protein